MRNFVGTGLLFLSLCMQGFTHGHVPEHLIQKAEDKYSRFVRNRFVAYNQLLESAKDSTEADKLQLINDFFNNVPYMSDKKNWQQEDYWATPIELIARDRGDCEDYVIAKLFALKAVGVDPQKLFMTYVKSNRFELTHMVLAYFETPDADPLILDNTNYKIFSASKRSDLTPIYIFNADSLYLARKKGKSIKINPKIHKKWDTLMQRIQRNIL